ncbi:MAG: FecR domain-containing protein [Bacteroidota bacterium]
MENSTDSLQTRLLPLLQRYETAQATLSDMEELFAILDSVQGRQALEDLLAQQLTEQHALELDTNHLASLAKDLIRQRAGAEMPAIPAHRVHFIRRFRWAAAAILVGIISFTGWLVLKDHKNFNADAIAKNDVKAPEKNKATITLPDGRQIVLDSVANGTLIAGVVRKTANGELVMEGNTSDIAYLVAHNPRNSKALHIELPDKTEVWLNAETDLQYPTSFTGKERMVALKGEAYFEVVHNNRQPFKVTAGEQIIEDIGTSFNVKNYPDEPNVKTTLLEGEVRINKSIALKPGQQYYNGKILSANTDEVMAWKNGSFYLDQRELGDVANDLGRWYDVDIVFNNAASKHSIVFGGKMGRDLSLQELISFLEKMEVKCRLEGKRLIID